MAYGNQRHMRAGWAGSFGGTAGSGVRKANFCSA